MSSAALSVQQLLLSVWTRRFRSCSPSSSSRPVPSALPGRYNKPDKPDDGARSARICRVLLDKKYLEQQQLSELAMMSVKETRERLYTMYRDHIVTFQVPPLKLSVHLEALWSTG